MLSLQNSVHVLDKASGFGMVRKSILFHLICRHIALFVVHEKALGLGIISFCATESGE